jgi:CheY-like chemotaxis protein
MGGEIMLKSTPGQGSRFSFQLRLPAAAPVIEQELTVDPAPVLGNAASGVRALIVEDQPLNQEVLSALLGRNGVTALVAGSGVEALGILRRREPVDLVLMDLRMPTLNGYEVARRIWAIPGCQDLPLIAVTGDASAAERERSRAAGFAAHLAKPIDQQALRKVLARFVHVPFGSASLSTQGLGSSTGAGEGGSLDLAPLVLGPGLTWPEALQDNEETGQSPDATKVRHEHIERLHRFAQRYAAYPRMIQTQLSLGEYQRAGATAHALAGVAVNLGMPRLGAAARQVEHAAKQGAEVSEALFSGLGLAQEEVLNSIAELVNRPKQGQRPPLSSQQGEAMADHPPSVPLDQAALIASLRRLDELLAAHNLRARATLEPLLEQLADHPDRQRAVGAISERVRRLDFDKARAALADLIEDVHGEEAGR